MTHGETNPITWGMLEVGLDVKNNSSTQFVDATVPGLLDGISIQKHPLLATIFQGNRIVNTTLGNLIGDCAYQTVVACHEEVNTNFSFFVPEYYPSDPFSVNNSFYPIEVAFLNIKHCISKHK